MSDWGIKIIKKLYSKIIQSDNFIMRFLRFTTSGIVFACLILVLLFYAITIEFSLDCAYEGIAYLIKHMNQTILHDIDKNFLSVMLKKIYQLIFDASQKNSAYDIFQVVAGAGARIIFCILASSCVIGYAIKQAQKSNKWYLGTYCFSLAIFLSCVVIAYQAYKLTEISIEHDRLYLDGAVALHPLEKVHSQHLSNIVIEPSIGTINDLKKIKSIIDRYDKVAMFIDHTTLLIQNNDLRERFISYIQDNADKIDLYTDIEFDYAKTGMITQMALSASKSQSFIYNECLQFAQELKKQYYVDFIFGPVLDRRTSSVETTIGARSFGQYVETLQENAFICTLAFQAAGIQAIPKHFPGHPHVIGKDINTHHGNYSTQYAEASLANNALSFLKLSSNPFIHIKTFMTDHIAIGSIDNELPYSIYFNLKTNKYGVTMARDFFLEGDSEYSFITDDLSMLIRERNNNKITSINSETKINYQAINPAVSRHIQAQAKNFSDLDITKATHTLALLARSALIAGHDKVLIRGLSVTGIEEFSSKFLAISNEDARIAQHAQKRQTHSPLDANLPSNDSSRSHDKENLPPFSIINIKNKNLYELNFVNLLNSDIFYFSSCISRDDVAISFGLMEKDHAIKSDFFTDSVIILKDALLNVNPTSKKTKIQNILSSKKFEYYIVALSNRESLTYFDTIYKYLQDSNELEKLIVFICNTPDMLNSFYGASFEKENGSIYNSTNFLCLYENSFRMSYYLTRAIKSNQMFLDSFQDIQSLPIDIPNFYLGASRAGNSTKLDIIDKLTNIAEHSSVLKNAIRIKVYLAIAMQASCLSFLVFCISLIIQWLINAKKVEINLSYKSQKQRHASSVQYLKSSFRKTVHRRVFPGVRKMSGHYRKT